jgi:multiple sugar transport system permease protein
VFRWIANSLRGLARPDRWACWLSSLAGYGFARLEFPRQDLAVRVVLAGLAVPEQR